MLVGLNSNLMEYFKDVLTRVYFHCAGYKKEKRNFCNCCTCILHQLTAGSYTKYQQARAERSLPESFCRQKWHQILLTSQSVDQETDGTGIYSSRRGGSFIFRDYWTATCRFTSRVRHVSRLLSVDMDLWQLSPS